MLKHDAAKALPYFYVGSKLVKERIARYKKNKHNLLSESLGKPDTKSVWYSKDHIEQLVDEMKHAKADGLRIHFGEYSEEENCGGQLCLLMVMTKINEAGIPVDITIEEAPDFNARSSSGEKPRDFNVGALCPPMCAYEGDGVD